MITIGKNILVAGLLIFITPTLVDISIQNMGNLAILWYGIPNPRICVLFETLRITIQHFVTDPSLEVRLAQNFVITMLSLSVIAVHPKDRCYGYPLFECFESGNCYKGHCYCDKGFSGYDCYMPESIRNIFRLIYFIINSFHFFLKVLVYHV